MTTEITDLKARNKAVREAITAVSEDNGITYTSIATRVGTSLSSFSQWRTGIYEYAVPNLRKVEAIIKRYTFND